MFQCKIDEIFSDMSNIYGITDDILVIGYDEDGADHDAVVNNVLRQCKEVNLKLNKDKCHFRCMSIPFSGEVVSREGVQPDPLKNQGADGNASTKEQEGATDLFRHN